MPVQPRFPTDTRLVLISVVLVADPPNRRDERLAVDEGRPATRRLLTRKPGVLRTTVGMPADIASVSVPELRQR